MLGVRYAAGTGAAAYEVESLRFAEPRVERLVRALVEEVGGWVVREVALAVEDGEGEEDEEGEEDSEGLHCFVGLCCVRREGGEWFGLE